MPTWGEFICGLRAIIGMRAHKWTRAGRPVVGGVPVNIKRCARCGVVVNVKPRKPRTKV